MSTLLKIGKKSINPKRAKNKRGTEGVFLTEREWRTVLDQLGVKVPHIKKKSVLAGSLIAIEEVEQYLLGKRKLRNAKIAVGEL